MYFLCELVNISEVQVDVVQDDETSYSFSSNTTDVNGIIQMAISSEKLKAAAVNGLLYKVPMLKFSIS